MTARRPLDLMLDVETLGRQPGYQILSIGATLFDPLGVNPAHKDPKNHFYIVINSFDAHALGFLADPETLRWWKKQTIWSHLGAEMMNSKVTVAQACKRFADFVIKNQVGMCWANSPTFDIEMMAAMHKKVNVPFPIAYRQHADFRTILDTAFPVREERPELQHATFAKHHALGDAIVQAEQLISALRALPALLTQRIVQATDLHVDLRENEEAPEPWPALDSIEQTLDVVHNHPRLLTRARERIVQDMASNDDALEHMLTLLREQPQLMERIRAHVAADEPARLPPFERREDVAGSPMLAAQSMRP